MAITDELREWARCCAGCAGGMSGDALRHIADRIDEAHKHAIGYVDDRDPETMAENGWVKLPVDADGVPIRIGDVVYDCNESPSEKFSVAIMELNKWGWSLLDSYGERNEPGQCHHYHAPTVEDVLRECIANVCRSNAQLYQQGCSPLTMEDIDEELDEYINEYAVRLRLAEEVDE